MTAQARPAPPESKGLWPSAVLAGSGDARDTAGGDPAQNACLRYQRWRFCWFALAMCSSLRSAALEIGVIVPQALERMPVSSS